MSTNDYNGYQAYGSGFNPAWIEAGIGGMTKPPKDFKSVPVPIPPDLIELSREAARYGIPPVQQEMSKWCPPNAACVSPYHQQRQQLQAALAEVKAFEQQLAKKESSILLWAAGGVTALGLVYWLWRGR